MISPNEIERFFGDPSQAKQFAIQRLKGEHTRPLLGGRWDDEDPSEILAEILTHEHEKQELKTVIVESWSIVQSESLSYVAHPDAREDDARRGWVRRLCRVAERSQMQLFSPRVGNLLDAALNKSRPDWELVYEIASAWANCKPNPDQASILVPKLLVHERLAGLAFRVQLETAPHQAGELLHNLWIREFTQSQQVRTMFLAVRLMEIAKSDAPVIKALVGIALCDSGVWKKIRSQLDDLARNFPGSWPSAWIEKTENRIKSIRSGEMEMQNPSAGRISKLSTPPAPWVGPLYQVRCLNMSIPLPYIGLLHKETQDILAGHSYVSPDKNKKSPAEGGAGTGPSGEGGAASMSSQPYPNHQPN